MEKTNQKKEEQTHRLLIVSPEGSLGAQLSCIAAALDYGVQTRRQVFFVPALNMLQKTYYWSTLFVGLPQILDPNAFAPIVNLPANWHLKAARSLLKNIHCFDLKEIKEKKILDVKEACVLWEKTQIPMEYIDHHKSRLLELKEGFWAQCFPDSYWAHALQIAQQSDWEVFKNKNARVVHLPLSFLSDSKLDHTKILSEAMTTEKNNKPILGISQLKGMEKAKELLQVIGGQNGKVTLLETWKWPDFINLLLLGILFWYSGGGIVHSKSKFARWAMYAAEYLQQYSSKLIQPPQATTTTRPTTKPQVEKLNWVFFC